MRQFGESNGYVCRSKLQPAHHITGDHASPQSSVFCLDHQQVTPSESSLVKKGLPYDPMLSRLCATRSRQGLKRVAMHVAAPNLRPVIFIRIRPARPSHGSLARAACRRAASTPIAGRSSSSERGHRPDNLTPHVVDRLARNPDVTLAHPRPITAAFLFARNSGDPRTWLKLLIGCYHERPEAPPGAPRRISGSAPWRCCGRLLSGRRSTQAALHGLIRSANWTARLWTPGGSRGDRPMGRPGANARAPARVPSRDACPP